MLQLEEGALESDVNRAFRKLALKHHPDKIGGDGGKFKEYGNARDTLLGKQPAASVAASESHRFVIYRIEGVTTWRQRRVYIGLVDTVKKSVAERMQEHRCLGSRCAAWLRAVPEQNWRRLDSASTMRLGLEKEAVYTGWELHGCGYKVVRGACVSMVSEKSARSKAAWERQTAAARELSVLPHGMEAALRYLRTKGDTLPSDVVKHLGNQCFCCGKVGHRAEDCPEVSKRGKERTPKQRAPTSRAKRKKGSLPKTKKKVPKQRRAKRKKKSGATRAREAKERDDASLAERIRYGKKGRAAAKKIYGQTYKEKPGHAADKKAWNRSTNQRASIKIIKRNYDESERANSLRRARLLRLACSS